LRELTSRRSKERLFPGLPEALGHNASAVRADIPRNGPFGKTRLIYCHEADGDDRLGALLNSSFEKQLTTT